MEARASPSDHTRASVNIFTSVATIHNTTQQNARHLASPLCCLASCRTRLRRCKYCRSKPPSIASNTPSQVVAGIIGYYLNEWSNDHIDAWAQRRWIYTEVIAGLSLLLGLLWLIPFAHTFFIWPSKFAWSRRPDFR